MKKTFINILRWLAVLPCAAIGTTIVYLIVNYSQLFYADENSKYAIYVIPVTASLASGVALIYSGAWSAPSHKKQTALILLVLSCLIMGYGIVRTLSESRYLDFAKDIASVVGVVIGYLVPKEELNSV